MTTPEDRFERLVEAFADRPGVTVPSGGRTFGSSALKVHSKIFAMLVGRALVVKLPRDRVAALVAAGDGAPFDAGKGRPMKEWVRVTVDDPARWAALAADALAFVGGRP